MSRVVTKRQLSTQVKKELDSTHHYLQEPNIKTVNWETLNWNNLHFKLFFCDNLSKFGFRDCCGGLVSKLRFNVQTTTLQWHLPVNIIKWPHLLWFLQGKSPFQNKFIKYQCCTLKSLRVIFGWVNKLYYQYQVHLFFNFITLQR